MKIKLIGIVSATLLAWAAVAAPASAGVWDFFTLGGSPSSNTNLGVTSYTFTQGSQSLTTDSMMWDSTSSSWVAGGGDLLIKNGGSTAEQGLGLNNDGDGEIVYPNAIELTGLTGHISAVTMGSLQAGEQWQILGSNDGSSWTPLGSGMGTPVTQTYSGANLMGYSDLLVWDPSSTVSPHSGSNNILLLSVTTVPEPGTLALLALGLAGVAIAGSRRRKGKFEA